MAPYSYFDPVFVSRSSAHARRRLLDRYRPAKPHSIAIGFEEPFTANPIRFDIKLAFCPATSVELDNWGTSDAPNLQTLEVDVGALACDPVVRLDSAGPAAAGSQ